MRSRYAPHIFIFLALTLIACQSNDLVVTNENYDQVTSKVAQYEWINPTLFLEAEGQYSENFWGDKFDVTAKITNSAKVASFKDVTLRITYYSRTNSIIGEDDYIVYERFRPQTIKSVELKVKNYRDVDTIGWEVISALPETN